MKLCHTTFKARSIAVVLAVVGASFVFTKLTFADPNSIHPELHFDEITIAEVLNERGYMTAFFGKWDLAGHNPVRFKPELLPTHQGFDTFFGTTGTNARTFGSQRRTLSNEKPVDRKKNGG